MGRGKGNNQYYTLDTRAVSFPGNILLIHDVKHIIQSGNYFTHKSVLRDHYPSFILSVSIIDVKNNHYFIGIYTKQVKSGTEIVYK